MYANMRSGQYVMAPGHDRMRYGAFVGHMCHVAFQYICDLVVCDMVSFHLQNPAWCCQHLTKFVNFRFGFEKCKKMIQLD